MSGQLSRNFLEVTLSDWSFDKLDKWDVAISDKAREFGLDWYPIVYEMCDYYEMIGHMSYHGMPSHYHHWSFGKSFERTHQLYKVGATGLPYELIINSNPSIAYLMRENPLYLQVLIMAHCVGHSDFFKNNRLFADTGADSILTRMMHAKRRIQEYIEDPSIGIDKVEAILDAAHSVSLNTELLGRKRVPHKVTRQKYIDMVKNDDENAKKINIKKVPLERDYDILGFMIEHGRHLEDWERDVLEIVRDESLYFIPQIRTKIVNEGWASFWHYKLLHELDIPQELHIPFLKSHSQVVSPHPTDINPYFVGFYLFNRIERERGLEECFFVRDNFHDETVIRQYVDRQACEDLGLFTFSRKRMRKVNTWSIDDVHDEDGWKQIREAMIDNVGVNRIPKIYVDDMDKHGNLIIRHDHDGRDLEIEFATSVVKNFRQIWGSDVRFFTTLEDEEFEI
jgi:stage V sporulation protein R